MATTTEDKQSTWKWGTCLLWFWGGISFSFVAILSLVLLLLLIFSAFLNTYLGWELAGLELSITRSNSDSGGITILTPSETPTPVASQVPAPLLDAVLTPESQGDMLIIPESPQIEMPHSDSPQEDISSSDSSQNERISPESSQTEITIPSQEVEKSEENSQVSTGPEFMMEAEKEEVVPVPTATPALVPTTPKPTAAPVPATSNNTYDLIPLEGERDSRPAPKHADLSLKLREPQEIDGQLQLLDTGDGSDEPPQLRGIIKPNVIQNYTLYNWDWECNCPTDLIDNPWGQVGIVEFATTPGQPIYIPKRQSDIYQGKYYAVVLYATENDLTFVYSREGTVANAYAAHYQGLQVDPNLLKLYRESEGNQLPGLTLDTPVGLTTDRLKIAIRDRGSFMDPRFKLDWWQ